MTDELLQIYRKSLYLLLLDERMKQFYKEITSLRRPPINLLKEDTDLFAHEYSSFIPTSQVTTYRNIWILKNMLFYPAGLRFINSYCLIHPIRKKDYIKNLLLLKRKPFVVDKAIWITDENAYGYFHWLTDCLTRLVVALPQIQSHKIILPQHLKRMPFIEDSLHYFNLDPVFYSDEDPVLIKELITPKHTAPTGNYHPEIINDLREIFTGINKQVPFRKIYISREKAVKRKITNEENVIALLKQYNFEIHYFEQYDLDKQINLMKESICLIGVHGAGLSNMLFMNKNSFILELRNTGDKINNCYYSLASDLQHKYYYLLNNGDSSDTHEVNLTVDIEKLKNIIELIGKQINS